MRTAAMAAVLAASSLDTSAAMPDKLVYLSFTAPVQVPGATLHAGVYRFHIPNAATSRVLQVRSEDGRHVYAAFHTIPERRNRARGTEPLLTLRETPAGAPPQARTLFYPGELVGYQFVYPR
jgi:hypothetical protein